MPTMEKLLAVPFEQRDQFWEDQFLSQLADCRFNLQQDHPITGPDNMPYLAVEVVQTGEPAQAVLRWVGERGVGLVVNPKAKTPDFVLTYGMVWNYLANGRFIAAAEPMNDMQGQFDIQEGQEMFAGLPSEQYLPPQVRKIFKLFLNEQGIKEPRIAMLSSDNKNFDLCFSAESLGHPPQSEWRGILEGFSWFFPLHYSLSIISESAIKDFQFTQL